MPFIESSPRDPPHPSTSWTIDIDGSKEEEVELGGAYEQTDEHYKAL